jgi:ribosomal protein L18
MNKQKRKVDLINDNTRRKETPKEKKSIRKKTTKSNSQVLRFCIIMTRTDLVVALIHDAKQTKTKNQSDRQTRKTQSKSQSVKRQTDKHPKHKISPKKKRKVESQNVENMLKNDAKNDAKNRP